MKVDNWSLICCTNANWYCSWAFCIVSVFGFNLWNMFYVALTLLLKQSFIKIVVAYECKMQILECLIIHKILCITLMPVSILNCNLLYACICLSTVFKFWTLCCVLLPYDVTTWLLSYCCINAYLWNAMQVLCKIIVKTKQHRCSLSHYMFCSILLN